MLHFEQEEQTRSQFWGRENRDSVTGRFVREYSMWKRWARYAMTMPIMVVFTGGVLLAMFMVRAVYACLIVVPGRGIWRLLKRLLCKCGAIKCF